MIWSALLTQFFTEPFSSFIFQSERKGIRSSKKSARRKARNKNAYNEKLIARVQPGLCLISPYEKRKMREELSVARSQGTITDGQIDVNCGYSSSGMFFKKLQDEVSQVLHDERREDY